MSASDPRTAGYRCPMCGASFMLRARLEEHREAEIPVFAARAALKRQASEARWRVRQVETGRMRPDGSWVQNWRPWIVETPSAPFALWEEDDW